MTIAAYVAAGLHEEAAMSSEDVAPTGPDLIEGVELSALPDGATLAGHVKGEAVMLVRRGAEVFAVGATCTHHRGPPAEGPLRGGTLPCPLHPACLQLRPGDAC